MENVVVTRKRKGKLRDYKDVIIDLYNQVKTSPFIHDQTGRKPTTLVVGGMPNHLEMCVLHSRFGRQAYSDREKI